jgi:hypothetical protein
MKSRMTRGLAIALALFLLVVAGGVLSTPGIAARQSSEPDWIGWKFQGTKCVQTDNDLVYAHVGVRMIVRNRGHFRHWATSMRVKARLIPPGSGLNLPRSWRTTRYPVHSQLFQDYNYSHDMAVNTDVMSPAGDWLVQVKLIWDRKAPLRDVVHEFKFPFNTANCINGKTPMTLA